MIDSKSIIRFNDTNGGNTKSIRIKNNRYIVERDINYLYEITGGEVIASSQYEIIDYIYDKLVVKNNYYMIYSSGMILADNFVYVSLKEDYFVGINKDNK